MDRSGSGCLDDVTGLAVFDRLLPSTSVDNHYEEQHPTAGRRPRRFAGQGGGAPSDTPASEPRVAGLHSDRALHARAAFDRRGAASLTGPRQSALAVPLQQAQPELSSAQPFHAEVIARGEPLLPHLANDPRYYPGLVGDDELDIPVQRSWQKYAWYGAAGLLLFGAGLTARSVWGGPSSWSAVIETMPVDAAVTIDGKAAAGTVSPYTQAELSSGEHVLRVTKPGFTEHHQAFTLNEGPEQRMFVIALAPEKPAADAEGPSEPAELASATPEDPAVEAETRSESPRARRERARKAKLESGSLSASERAKQRRSERRAARVSARYRTRGGSSVGPTDAVAAAEPKRATGKTGTLQVNSLPWAEVYVDNKRVGNTPQRALTLSAGRHTIKLSNPTLGLSKTFKVKIRAGETLSKVETLK